MGKYYVDGYKVPDGVNSADDVLEWQKKLGVTQDGIWGKNTQAAYEKYMQNGSSTDDGFDWEGMSERIKNSLTEILRPAVDAAIARRRAATETDRAEIDADAAARGMASSTYVSDVKANAQKAENEDIQSYETGYNQTLAQTLQSMLIDAYKNYTQTEMQKAQLDLEERKLKESQSQFNRNLAFRYEQQKAASQQQKQQNEAESSGEQSAIGNGYSFNDYITYMNELSYAERKWFFNSDDVYWTYARERMIADIGYDDYKWFENQFGNPGVHEEQDTAGEYGVDYFIA